MNPIFTQVIIETVLRQKGRKSHRKQDYTPFEIASGYRELRITVLTFLRDVFLIALGITSAAFGLESFLVPNKFIDGGATGISLLITELTSIPLSYLLLLVNIPFLVLGFNVVSRQFAIRAALAIIGLAAAIALIQFPEVTRDKLLVAVFGGFFLGAGIGLSIRGGAVLDGTEVLAIFVSRKAGTTVGDIIIIINIIIFSAAAYFLSVETALYSMLTYLSASKTLDFVIEGIEEYTGVTIVSVKSEEMRLMITEKLGRGVTVFKGKRGFGTHGHRDEVDIVYTVITRLEVSKLNTEIEKIDPHAFVVMNSVKDTKGGMIKKRAHKH
ncbi:MAG TPA: YitT family protein [Bacteroidia bacterium]|nr:YitT family protein [Bacteroidia bacterium]